MKHVEQDRVLLRAMPGAHVNSAIGEAVVYAFDCWCVVVLTHNEKKFEIDPHTICELVRAGKAGSMTEN